MTWPAWRDGRRIGTKGPTLHAVTDTPAGHTFRSGFRALCGHSVRFKVLDVFDPEDPQACERCAVLALLKQPAE